MIIDSVDCGYRTIPAELRPQEWASAGISYSGAVTKYSFGKKEYNVTFSFRNKSASIKTGLIALTRFTSYNITPDTGDDLDVGAAGATSMILTEITARPITGSALFDIDVSFKYIVSS